MYTQCATTRRMYFLLPLLFWSIDSSAETFSQRRFSPSFRRIDGEILQLLYFLKTDVLSEYFNIIKVCNALELMWTRVYVRINSKHAKFWHICHQRALTMIHKEPMCRELDFPLNELKRYLGVYIILTEPSIDNVVKL